MGLMEKTVNAMTYDLLLFCSFFTYAFIQPSVQVSSLSSINTTENILGSRHVCAYRYGNKHDKYMPIF